jgi:hypothetical protein
MERTQAGRRPATARLFAVCAVLFGLFLMHGAPSAAAGGCHGSMPAALPMAPAAAMAQTAHAAGAHTAPVASGSHAPRMSVTGMDGRLCVSTPARGSVPLPAAGLMALAVLTGWALTGRRAAMGGFARRGPPGGGRNLLLRVCVART